MKVAISNLAWDPANDEQVAGLIRNAGAQGVEIAPSKIWPTPNAVDGKRAASYRDSWMQRGVDVVSMQSLLFGRPDLKLFADEESRENLFEYLKGVIATGGALGAHTLVFGSPVNRSGGLLDGNDRWPVAVDFFRRLGDVASRNGTVLCIEPNPPQYRCDFVTNTAEGIRLVRDVDNPGFRLHVDSAVLTMNGEEPETALLLASDALCHFHASEPDLAPVGPAGVVEHRRMADALRAVGYDGWVSIEMRPPGSLDAIAVALDHVVAIYG